MKYIFRGLTILEYDTITKQVRTPVDADKVPYFNQCKFIPEDYQLLALYYDTCYKHAEGQDVELKDIVVNI